MKIPSCLTKSRHGVYYYRVQFTLDFKRKEHRFSLSTKCPSLAKAKAIQISAIMVQRKLGSFNMSQSPFDPKALSDLLKNADQHLKMDVVYSRSGVEFRQVNTPEDHEGVATILARLNAGYEASIAQHQSTPTPPPIQGGSTLKEMIERFATRKEDKLKGRSRNGYRARQVKFADWLAIRKNNDAFPMRLITRTDIADFIHDLQREGGKEGDGLEDSTIQNGYLAPLAGLFELAQDSGIYPTGDNPARGHKVFTKADKKKTESKSEYKPFTDLELTHIFNPTTFLALKRPDDYWLPLLGLFTGGRIEELCQLANSDIKKMGDLWAISINDDEYKSLKSNAARRDIPLHPQLIKLGFLEYCEIAKRFGTMLFPYLNPDKDGKFSPTPSENFGKYLDTLGLIDRQKVFHSFRKTSNNTLKQKGVTEETRCQYIGHEYETTNSTDYGEDFSLEYLAKHVSSKLTFEVIKFDKLAHPAEHFLPSLKKLCKYKTGVVMRKERKEIVAEREKALEKRAKRQK